MSIFKKFRVGKTYLGKSFLGNAFSGTKQKTKQTYTRAKDKFKPYAKYAPSPIGASLYGISLVAPIKIAKYSYKASQIWGASEIPIEVYRIISLAYRDEKFYKASWQIKSKVLSKDIIQSPVIQRNIAEATLSAIIYEIMKKNKNRQGNEDLAKQITEKANLQPNPEYSAAEDGPYGA